MCGVPCDRHRENSHRRLASAMAAALGYAKPKRPYGLRRTRLWRASGPVRAMASSACDRFHISQRSRCCIWREQGCPGCAHVVRRDRRGRCGRVRRICDGSLRGPPAGRNGLFSSHGNRCSGVRFGLPRVSRRCRALGWVARGDAFIGFVQALSTDCRSPSSASCAGSFRRAMTFETSDRPRTAANIVWALENQSIFWTSSPIWLLASSKNAEFAKK